MYRFAADLLQPYTLLFLLTGLAVLNLWRKRREARGRLAFATLALGALALLSVPAVSHLALGSLEWQYPPQAQRPADTQAIVVLAAGVLPASAAGPAELDDDSLRRCLHAARLYRQGPPCPVLVSGGKVDPEAPEPPAAHLMRAFLLRLGVAPADVLVEDVSRTTYENAAECARLLRQRGLERVVLVTDAVGMFRAERCFRKQGLGPTPSPSHYRAAEFEWSLFTFLPRPGGARGVQRAWHEWAGVLWYWSRGRA